MNLTASKYDGQKKSRTYSGSQSVKYTECYYTEQECPTKT